MFGDSFFKKVEDKSGVNKATIMSLANKLQKSNMKDEKVLRELVQEIGDVAGRSVSKDKEDKIVNVKFLCYWQNHLMWYNSVTLEDLLWNLMMIVF